MAKSLSFGYQVKGCYGPKAALSGAAKTTERTGNLFRITMND